MGKLLKYTKSRSLDGTSLIEELNNSIVDPIFFGVRLRRIKSNRDDVNNVNFGTINSEELIEGEIISNTDVNKKLGCGNPSIISGNTDIINYYFTTNQDIYLPSGYTTMEYLIVGGGGSGGGTTTNNSASGGGAGGQVIEGTISNPDGGLYTIVVGAGGAAWPSNSSNVGRNGNISSITFPDASVITTISVGGGASSSGQADYAAQYNSGGGSSISPYQTVQEPTEGGYKGGNGTVGTAAGGGGGAHGTGSTATSTSGTANGGGAGKVSVYFGETYGVGGGSWAVHGTMRGGINGREFTGNGGSGANRTTVNIAAGSGGSGVVLIRLTR